MVCRLLIARYAFPAGGSSLQDPRCRAIMSLLAQTAWEGGNASLRRQLWFRLRQAGKSAAGNREETRAGLGQAEQRAEELNLASLWRRTCRRGLGTVVHPLLCQPGEGA